MPLIAKKVGRERHARERHAGEALPSRIAEQNDIMKNSFKAGEKQACVRLSLDKEKAKERKEEERTAGGRRLERGLPRRPVILPWPLVPIDCVINYA